MTDFLTIKNKEFIWGLLSDKQMFDGINPKYKIEIQERFEKTLIGISTQGKIYNLVEKNKEAIRSMVLILDEYKKSKEPYTTSEIQERRQKHFESELEKKKKEFNITSKTPNIEDMNFSDEIDKPLGENMEILLERAMALRAQQLNQVLEKQDTQKATEWIGTSVKSSTTSQKLSSSNSNTNSNTNTNVLNLKIGNETQLTGDTIVSLDKKVNFNEDRNTFFSYQRENEDENNIETNSFFNKFKKIDKENKINNLENKENKINNLENKENKINNLENKEEIQEKFKIINDKLDRVLLNQKEILDYIKNIK
jgi:hypothetical protein